MISIVRTLFTLPEGECLELFYQDKGLLFKESDILHSSFAYFSNIRAQPLLLKR